MIGAYILTRMVQLLSEKQDGKISATRIFAALTIVVTLYCIYSLVTLSADVTGMM